MAIEESKDMRSMKIEELQSSLKAHEQKVNERNSEKKEEQGLQALANFKKGGYGGKDKEGKRKMENGKWEIMGAYLTRKVIQKRGIFQ